MANRSTGASKKMGKSQTPVKKKNKKRNKKAERITLLVILSILVVCVLTAAIVVGYVFFNITAFAHGELAINLDDYKANQNQTSFIYAYNSKNELVEMAQLHGEENRIWVDFDQMPEHLKNAFICLEDKRFEKHHGVDWLRTFGAATGLSTGGGSTITQQLVKNITRDKSVTVVRKFKEIERALNLEQNYSKDTILEAYLNTLYLGNGCYGVQTASETYFGKDVSELNLAECATLAVITKAPTTYNPLLNPESNKARQELCLEYMLENDAITKEEYEEAVNYKLVFTNSEDYVPKAGKTKATTEDKNDEKEYQDFYVDYVIKTVCKDLMSKYGYTYRQAMELINYGGLKIYSAANLDVQSVLNTVYSNRIAFDKEADTAEHPAAQSAATVMDYEGRIVGIVGQAGEKNGNLCLNRASESPRQPGSSIKPLSTYSLALEKNYINWSSMILNYSIYQKGKLWPQNSDGTNGTNTDVTVQYAIQKSLNTVPVRIITEMLGVNEAYNFMKKTFHLSTLDDANDANIAPLATGSLTNGVTTVEMAAAYAVFGNNGYYYKPYCYYKVTNATGTEVLLETKPEAERVLSEDTAEVMRELLKTVPAMNFRSSKYLGKFELMSKTGTTSDTKDSWIAGGTPYYVCAVWFGYDKPKDIPFRYSASGRIYIEILDRMHKALPEKSFPKTGKVEEKDYCKKTGLLASPYCKETAKGYYKKSAMPAECTECGGGAVATVVEGVSDAVNNIIEALSPTNARSDD